MDSHSRELGSLPANSAASPSSLFLGLLTLPGLRVHWPPFPPPPSPVPGAPADSWCGNHRQGDHRLRVGVLCSLFRRYSSLVSTTQPLHLTDFYLLTLCLLGRPAALEHRKPVLYVCFAVCLEHLFPAHLISSLPLGLCLNRQYTLHHRDLPRPSSDLSFLPPFPSCLQSVSPHHLECKSKWR